MSTGASLPRPKGHRQRSQEEVSQTVASSSLKLPGVVTRRPDVGFRVHQPAHKRMIRIGRGARVSISVGLEWRDNTTGPPRTVRRVHESRRFLTIAQANAQGNPRKEEEQQNREPVSESFIFANYISFPRTRIFFFSGLKKDDGYDTPGTDSLWLTESEPDTPAEVEDVKLHLRGGCLSLPERQGSKRRLGDDDELPMLVWWAAGGRPRHKPLNGKQLREWKRRSNGYDKGNKKRGWFREFAFVMTSGRVGRDSGKPKPEGSQDAGTRNDGTAV